MFDSVLILILLNHLNSGLLFDFQNIKIRCCGSYLCPSSFSDSLVVLSLVSCSIGKHEDEDSVSPSFTPAPVQHVSIGECLIARTMLLTLSPCASEDVSVGKVVWSPSVSLIILEIPNILITSITTIGPPKLTKATLENVKSNLWRTNKIRKNIYLLFCCSCIPLYICCHYCKGKVQNHVCCCPPNLRCKCLLKAKPSPLDHA